MSYKVGVEKYMLGIRRAVLQFASTEFRIEIPRLGDETNLGPRHSKERFPT